MPRSKNGIKRKPVAETALKAGLNAIVEQNMSIREAEKVFKVSRATLARQLKKFKESESFQYKANYASKQVFSFFEENALVKYITNVARMHYGLTKKGVRELAYSFAKANKKKCPENWDKNQMAGEEWMRGFMKRHEKVLSVRKPEATSLSRSTSFNRHNVQSFFDNLTDVHSRFGPIPPEKIWNLDETGLGTVQTTNSKIIAPKGDKQLGGVTSAERGQLVTLIAAVNAIGNSSPPLLIFPRVHFKDRMIHGAPLGTIGSAQVTDWTNEQLFTEFLHHFLKFIKCSKENRALLILDNHESHLSPEALEIASASGLIILTFPPHCTDKLQPLDVSVFGPLRIYYNKAIENWMYNNIGKTFDIYCVAQALGQCYTRAFTPQNIQSGFRATGIYPLNSGIFTDAHFARSSITDRPELQEDIVGVPMTHPSSETNLKQSLPTTTPSQSQKNNAMISPEDIIPYPKAVARKAKGRRLGKSMIATDTPQKKEIIDRKMKSRVKKENMENRKTSKKLNFNKKIPDNKDLKVIKPKEPLKLIDKINEIKKDTQKKKEFKKHPKQIIKETCGKCRQGTEFENFVECLECSKNWHSSCLPKNYEFNVDTEDEDAAFLCPMCTKELISDEETDIETVDDFEEEEINEIQKKTRLTKMTLK